MMDAGLVMGSYGSLLFTKPKQKTKNKKTNNNKKEEEEDEDEDEAAAGSSLHVSGVRPDSNVFQGPLVVFNAVEKADSDEFAAAQEQYSRSLTAWSPFFFGRLPILPGYVAAGPQLEPRFYASSAHGAQLACWKRRRLMYNPLCEASSALTVSSRWASSTRWSRSSSR